MTENYEGAAFIIASQYRMSVVQVLGGTHATPSTIAEHSELDITHVSRSLSKLRDKGLVELLVPETTRKGRIYGLTESGRTALDTAENLEVEA